MQTHNLTIGCGAALKGLLVVAAVCAAAAPRIVNAARTILFETFENDTPDVDINTTVPESLDLYVRSLVVAPPDPSFAYITGGLFADPFSSGNQSLLLHNPNAAAQMTANFYDFFDADPMQFRNGVIEFDLFMEAAEPGSLWTFLDIRFGFDADENRAVTTEDDVTIWNTLRMQEGGNQAGAQDILYDYNSAETYSDQAVIVPERKMRVRYDINGAGSGSFTVSIDNLEDPDPPVDIVWPSGAVKAWDTYFNFVTFQHEPAPGINVIAFLTDASGYASGAQKSQNVYIDNLRVINNDLPPLEENADFDGDGDVDGQDFLAWQRGNGTTSGALPSDGDADGDETVNGADLDIWKQQFGQPLAVGSLSAAPEPTGAALSLAACASAAAMHRRRQRGLRRR